MRELSLIITTRVLNEELKDGTFYFKLNFSKMFQDSHPVSELEFIEGITSSFDNFKNDWKIIREKLESAGFKIELTNEVEVWQNSDKDIVITQRGILKFEKEEDFKQTILEIKKEVLINNIFLKVEFYV